MSSYLPRLRSLKSKVLDLIKPLYQTSRNCLESALVSKYLLIIVGKWSWPRLPKSVRPKTIWLIPWSTQSCVVFVPRKILAWKEIIKKCSSIGPPWESISKNIQECQYEWSELSSWQHMNLDLTVVVLHPFPNAAVVFLQLCKLLNSKKVLKGQCLATRIRIENLENTLGRKPRYFESERRLWISIRCALYSTIVRFNHSKIPERVLLHKTTIYSQ